MQQTCVQLQQVNQDVHLLVPMTQEAVIHVKGPVQTTQEEVNVVPKAMQQTRVQLQQVNQDVHLPVAMTREEVVHASRVMQQARINIST